MYDNLLYQNATKLLKEDILHNQFPQSVLFSGPQGSGKLTAALETARILSCKGNPRGKWQCDCSSCVQQKSLLSQNVILSGSRDCSMEIAAASYAFLRAVSNKTAYLAASRYFFLRSVRKLTLRFNQILWEDSDKYNKIGALAGDIEEALETLDFPHELPNEMSNIEKSCKQILDLCKKLEDGFLYDSIPISQVRNMSSWAHLKSVGGCKTIIIENADRMLENVRNALLKILEEPPEDTFFILTTARRNAIMPTILSRVRTYSFNNRTLEEQYEVIDRVFHRSDFKGSINEYLLSFLPVSPDSLRQSAHTFFETLRAHKIPEIPPLIKECGNFDPRIMFKLFLVGIIDAQKSLLLTSQGTFASGEIVAAIKDCWNNVTVYNQGIQAALESLVREFIRILRTIGVK
ncbi:MAG: DNA polymerase III [Treponema sp.]|nr:DNA polymerase III [Treponema sp.]MBD5410599.1 DNA polymerase III [Treponema sp.]